MASWACPGCRTVYAVGIPACPNCEGGIVAKVGAAGPTQYVAEGDPVPEDLPAAVRLVGPGAPRRKAKVPASGTPAPPAAVEPRRVPAARSGG